MDETLKTALAVAQVFDKLKVRWFLGGSLASSLLGIPRATLDADIVADIHPELVAPFLKSLGDAWYADEHVIREAITSRSSFNLIHYDTAMKVDVFVHKRRLFEAGQFTRVKRTPVAEGSDIEVPVCSPEDIVVAKLEWFRLGRELSERQWADVIGVLRINAGRLDAQIMQVGAEELGVSDLLAKAVAESEETDG